MKNILIIDEGANCVYDIFAAPDKVFDLVFEANTDIAFVEELEKRDNSSEIFEALGTIWGNRVPKAKAQGIHGTLFYQGLLFKRKYYPTLRDEEAMNPDGSRLRAGGATTLGKRPFKPGRKAGRTQKKRKSTRRSCAARG